MPKITDIRLRRGTSASWAATNPVLGAGEPGWDSTVGQWKVGDGTSTWNSLPYVGDATRGIQAWSQYRNIAAGERIVTPAGDVVKAFEPHSTGLTFNDGLYHTDQHGFLAANFTYNSWEGEKLNLFFSPEGKTITGHGPNPVFSPATGLRDPAISRIGDKWFMSYGFHSPELKQFAVASSDDLLNWSTIATLNVSAVTNLSQAWAPELFQNPEDGSVYIFFTSVWASGATLEVWYVKATNTALTAWSAPTKLSWSSQPAKAMDPVFTKNGNTWYMFYGDNNYICRATATSLLGPWTVDKTGDWAGWGINKEAPQIVRLATNKWRLYIDRYEGTSPNWTYPGYAFTESTDLLNWTALTPLTMGPDNKNNIVLRHGSFIPIKDSATAAQVHGAMHSGAATIRHAEYTGSVILPNGQEASGGTLTLDTARSFNTSDFSHPASGQVKVGATGLYSVTLQAGNGANNFGGSGEHWVSITSPTHDGTMLRNVANSGYELSVSDGGLYLNAGDILEVKLMQASGAQRTVNFKLRVTKVA